MADQVLMPNQTTHGHPFFLVVLTPSCCDTGNKNSVRIRLKIQFIELDFFQTDCINIKLISLQLDFFKVSNEIIYTFMRYL